MQSFIFFSSKAKTCAKSQTSLVVFVRQYWEADVKLNKHFDDE